MNISEKLLQNSLPGMQLGNKTPVRTDSASSPSSSSGASVSANDFLTLLVTELKNQDPTANTDPNAYVNQLVQVNSLQQLIQINGDLTSSPQSPTTPA